MSACMPCQHTIPCHARFQHKKNSNRRALVVYSRRGRDDDARQLQTFPLGQTHQKMLPDLYHSRVRIDSSTDGLAPALNRSQTPCCINQHIQKKTLHARKGPTRPSPPCPRPTDVICCLSKNKCGSIYYCVANNGPCVSVRARVSTNKRKEKKERKGHTTMNTRHDGKATTLCRATYIQLRHTSLYSGRAWGEGGGSIWNI